MEVMSQPWPERPFTKGIDSELTRFEMERRPHGQPCTVRFRWCSVNFVREHHFIGGERTRTVEHYDELEGPGQEVPHRVDGGPAVFRSKSACRGAIRRMLMEVLPPLIQYYDVDRTEEGQWDEFVPAGLVERIVEGSAGGGSYACDVWMHVEVTRVYGEAEELLLLCEAAAAAPPSGSAPRAGDACPICMEELAGGGVTGLPDCSHAFHRECILEWFRKAPTCPCCRRDMAHYLDFRRRPYRTSAEVSAAAAAAVVSEELEEFVSHIDAARRVNPSALGRRRRRRTGPYSVQHAARSYRRALLLLAVRYARDGAPDGPLFEHEDVGISLL